MLNGLDLLDLEGFVILSLTVDHSLFLEGVLIESTDVLLLGYLALCLVACYGVDMLVHVIHIDFHDLLRIDLMGGIPSTGLTSRLVHMMLRQRREFLKVSRPIERP